MKIKTVRGWFRIERKRPLIEAIKQLHKNDDSRIIKDELYSFLDILEEKNSSLLIFNSITAVIAVSAIDSKHHIASIFLYFAVIFLMLSSMIALMISQMNWGFLQKVSNNANEENEALAKIVDSRTVKFICAWKLSFLSVTIILVALSALACHEIW